MDTIKEANRIIKEGIALLPDEAKSDYKTPKNDIFIYEAINNACGMTNKNDEKEALLGAFAVQEANRVVTTLWREKLLTEELEAAYRALPTMKEMADIYNKFTSDRKARMDKVMEQHHAIAEEEKEFDIFKAVINGMNKEEAEKEYEAYRQQQMQAVGGK